MASSQWIATSSLPLEKRRAHYRGGQIGNQGLRAARSRYRSPRRNHRPGVRRLVYSGLPMLPRDDSKLDPTQFMESDSEELSTGLLRWVSRTPELNMILELYLRD